MARIVLEPARSGHEQDVERDFAFGRRGVALVEGRPRGQEVEA
jgi:hypothetical protein